MNKLVLTVGVVLLMTGCASTTAYPNKSFIKNNEINAVIAKETAAHIKKENINNISVKVEDDFGVALIHQLKQNKTVVREISAEDFKNATKEERSTKYKPDLIYFSDEIDIDNNALYRVSFNYKSTDYSRLYGVKSGVLMPISNWSIRTGANREQ